MENHNDFIKRKIELAKFDLQTAFECNAKHTSQITSIRGWSITLVVAYLGFAFTKSETPIAFLHIIPVFFVIIGFFFLEFIERIDAKLNAKNVRHLQMIFSEKNEDVFVEKVTTYTSRDIYVKQHKSNERKVLIKEAIRQTSIYYWPLFIGGAALVIWYLLSKL